MGMGPEEKLKGSVADDSVIVAEPVVNPAASDQLVFGGRLTVDPPILFVVARFETRTVWARVVPVNASARVKTAVGSSLIFLIDRKLDFQGAGREGFKGREKTHKIGRPIVPSR